MLEEVKQRLSITGNDLDPTINGMIDDVVAFCLSAGVKYSQLVKPDVIGLVARGVADLWNYGAGDGKFSEIFHMRLNQLCIAAYSIEGDLLPQSKAVAITENGTTEIKPDEGYLLTGLTVETAVPPKPEQSKAVTITENGITEITPDEGYALSRAVIETAVPSKPEQAKAVTITENGTTAITPDEGYLLTGVTVETAVPPKPEQSKAVTITENGITEITPDEGYALSNASVTVNVAPPVATIPYINTNTVKSIYANITKIDFGNVTWLPNQVSSLDSLFKDMASLNTINWNGIKAAFYNSVYASNMFYGCKSIQEIDISPLNIGFITSVNSMFQDCTNLKRVNWGNIKVRVNAFTYMFYKCTSLKTLDASFIDPEYTQTNGLAYMFAQCTSLEFVDLSNLKTLKVNGFSMAFSKCTALKNIVFENECFSNPTLKEVPLSDCPLSHDCAVDIFNKLAMRSNSPVLKLSATTKGYLTANEIAIATGKGWVVS